MVNQAVGSFTELCLGSLAESNPTIESLRYRASQSLDSDGLMNSYHLTIARDVGGISARFSETRNEGQTDVRCMLRVQVSH